MSKFITKKGKVEKGSQGVYNVGFEPANAEELAAVTKALGADELPAGYIAGWASTPDIDSYNHKVVAGAFSESIAKRGLNGPKGIKLLIGHSWNQLAGEIKKLEYRGNRLWIEAQLALDIGYVNDAYKAAKILGGTNFSVGFMLQDYEFKETSDGSEYLQINRGDLFEVSVVPFPGNEEATMTFIKSADGSFEMDEEDEALPTVSEFEKALVRSELVKSRNQAREITKLIKANLSLFTPTKDEPVSTKGQEPKGPVLDLNAITTLSAKIAEMKAILS
jgi:HK97 family phage prohead protease